MSLEYIRRKSDELIRRYGTREPFRLAREMGIRVYPRSDFTRLKGMYKVILRSRCIFINAALPAAEEKIVLAHEIGHDVLHRELAKSSFLSDEWILDLSLQPEYEANLFAANLLLEDEAVLEAAERGGDLVSVAGILETDPSLVALKARLLRDAGIPIRELPYDPDFLKSKSDVAKSRGIW